MDEDILAELDKKLSNVNLDKTWTKKIGDHEVVFTTLDYVQLTKTKAALEKGGDNTVDEVKRLTLAGSIVGFDGADLSSYRTSGKTLKVRGKDGKAELIDLSEFLYRKIAGWDGEFIDLAFEVFSDIMDGHRKSMVKDIKFENARSAEEELEALEERAASIRQGMGLPPLVPAARLDSDDGEEEGRRESRPPAPELRIPDLEDDAEPAPPGAASFVGDEEDFDPFAAIRSAVAPMARPPAPAPAPAPSSPPASLDVPVPVPSRSPARVPSDASRAVKMIDGVPVPVHVAQPSVSSDVLDSPASRTHADFPSIDVKPSSQNRNPRFRRT